MATLPVRLDGLGLHDPQVSHPGARIASFVSTSMAAADFRLPQIRVSAGDVAALNALTPACGCLVAGLRNKLSVGSPISAGVRDDPLFET